jgi:chaperonin GroEL
VALIRASAGLDGLGVSEDEKAGVRVVQRALQEPLRWIATNAGTEGSIVVDRVRNGTDAFGFNAATEQFEDLLKTGIVDPTKVVRTALQNAASVAGPAAYHRGDDCGKPEKKKEVPPMPPSGDDF